MQIIIMYIIGFIVAIIAIGYLTVLGFDIVGERKKRSITERIRKDGNEKHED